MRRLCRATIVPKSAGPRYWLLTLVCGLVLAAGPGPSLAAPQPPVGVYAQVGVAQAITEVQKSLQIEAQQPICGYVPPYQASKTNDIHIGLQNLYESLMLAPGVSGIAVGIPWCLLQPCPPSGTSAQPWCQSPTFPQGYDFSYVQDAVLAANAAAAVEKKNGNDLPPPTVQLIVIPGVDTPSWLLPDLMVAKQIPPCPTNPGAKYPSNCGWLYDQNMPEASHGQSFNLPMPWDDLYVSYWTAFLKTLAATIAAGTGGPYMLTAPPLVSIAVAEPVGASDEMILPTFPNKNNPHKPHDRVWTPLIAHAVNCTTNCSQTLTGYANYPIYHSDSTLNEQVFVDAWNATIDMYEQVFANSNLTLILVADAGTGLPAAASLPDPTTQDVKGVDGNTLEIYKLILPHDHAALLPDDCGGTPTLSCQAKAEILAHFAAASTSGSPSYLKATDVGGMVASSNIKSSTDPKATISVIGVKILTSPRLLQTPAPFQPLLGGAEFDHAVSSGPKKDEKETGCLPGKSAPPCTSPEERAFNVLDAFFNCTQIGARLRSDTTFKTACQATSAPLTNSSPSSTIQFVHVDYQDVEYAEGQHPCPAKPFPVPVNSGEKHKMCWSMQDLLSQANYDLFEMAGQPLRRQPIFTCQHQPTGRSCTPQ
jgi:hypothetical protein